MSYLITCITLITAFFNSNHSEIECKSRLRMIKLTYFISKLIFSREICPVWFTANCCGADMFSMVCSQLLWCWRVQYGLQPIAVVLTCSVCFITNYCAAHMFSRVYSQLLCCSHVQYGLQPIAVLLTCSLWLVYCQLLCCSHVHYGWFTANCCAAHVFSVVYS